jgi:hypothetical protein
VTGRPYGLLLEPGFDEQLKAAPDDVQSAFREALAVLLVNPLPGRSLLDVRPLENWLPDSYSAALPGGSGLLNYRVPVEQRTVVLVSLTWL